VQESVKTGLWVGDCFIYTNSVNRLNYYVGGEIVTVAHLDRVMYLLGYIPENNSLYLGDKELNVVSFGLQLSVLEYQTAVMRRDFETADRVLPSVPKEQRTRVAHFLEKQGFKQQALAVSVDPEHRFELSLQLGELKLAHQLAEEAQSEHKWKQLADIATSKCQFDLAHECLHKAQDFGGLLLLATASGNAENVRRLGDDAVGAGMNNVAFLTRFLSGDLNACLEILLSTNRIPEAAFFARTYLPSQISRVVKLWKVSLGQINAKAGQSLADPEQYDNLFPGLSDALKTEQFLAQQRVQMPSSAYPSMPTNWERQPVEEMHQAEQHGQFQPFSAAVAAVAAIEEDVHDEVEDDVGDDVEDEVEGEQVEETEVNLEAKAAIQPQESSVQQNLVDLATEKLVISQPIPPIPPVAPITPVAPVAPITPLPMKNLLDDDDEEFHDTMKTSNEDMLDQELELDLASLEYDDNVDTSEINLDDDLLDD